MITWHFKKFENLTTTELYKIIQLRIEVFVIEQNAPYQDCDGRDFRSLHVYGTIGEDLVAYARGIPAGGTYDEPCLGRVVTAPTYRGKKYGAHVVYLTLESMKTQFKTTNCRISAQLYLQNFYENYGFERVSDVYLEDGLPHVEMVRP